MEFLRLGSNVKQGLAELKSSHPAIQAIFMGCRRTDPNCGNLSSMQVTDTGWPEYMRVSPMLDWTYHDVWSFIRGLWLPYAVLYDKGYTSIGSPDNTLPNPALECTDRAGFKRHHPAYMLNDGDLERQARL